MELAEEWRPIVGYEGAYEVSDLGRVRSLDRLVYAGPSRTRKAKGRLLSIYSGGHYPKVGLKADGMQVTRNVHVLVAEAFIGPRPDGMDVCHNNGDRHDNRASNLRYDTHSANQSDQTNHGTHWRGRRTHCQRGHEFTPENTFIRSTERNKGGRRCITCERERSRTRWLAKSSA